MRQGIIVCPIKGEQSLEKCERWRMSGMASCCGCSVRPKYLGKRHGATLAPENTCPECGLYKPEKTQSGLCGACHKTKIMESRYKK